MIVVQTRGGFEETAHPVSAAAVHIADDGQPAVVATAGPPRTSPWRSAGKPWQLLSSLHAIGEAAGRSADAVAAGVEPAVLALGASSHSGEAGHTAAVEALLAGWGFSASDLRCGAEPPAHAPTHAGLLAAGGQPSALHNDCSGKHAFMLGACRARGWSTDYLPAEHPLQQRIIGAVARATGVAPGLAIDGCGVPTFVLSVAAMATAWARLAAAMGGSLGDDAPADTAALGRIGRAMAANPWWVSGTGRIDAHFAAAAAEPILTKIGAQGVFNVALPARRLGLALKVHSGDDAAVAVAAEAWIRAVAPGALRADVLNPWAVASNVVGRPIGARLVTGLNGV